VEGFGLMNCNRACVCVFIGEGHVSEFLCCFLVLVASPSGTMGCEKRKSYQAKEREDLIN